MTKNYDKAKTEKTRKKKNRKNTESKMWNKISRKIENETKEKDSINGKKLR